MKLKKIVATAEITVRRADGTVETYYSKDKRVPITDAVKTFLRRKGILKDNATKSVANNGG